jgi:DNA-binding TFAR19-related protein (PDSD5 family)
MNEEIDEKLELQKQIQGIERIAKQYLSKEALIRYGNLKMAFPEKAIKVATLIVQLINNNEIIEKVDDEKFKFLLKQLEDKKEFRIIR